MVKGLLVVVILLKLLGIASSAFGMNLANIIAPVADEITAGWANCVSVITAKVIGSGPLAVGNKAYGRVFPANSAFDGASLCNSVHFHLDQMLLFPPVFGGPLKINVLTNSAVRANFYFG